VRILQTESSEAHLRIAVRQSVSGPVAIEEQVRRVHHPNAAAPRQHTRRDVQARDDILVSVECAIAVRVFQHGDLVHTPDTVGWRCRYGVESSPQVLVVRGDVEAGGKRILEVLDDPQPSAIVEVQVDGLANHRLRRDQLDR
jgi:hypothetical protein